MESRLRSSGVKAPCRAGVGTLASKARRPLTRVGQEFNLQVAVETCLGELLMENRPPPTTVGKTRFGRYYDHICKTLDGLVKKREVKRWVKWTSFPPKLTQISHYYALKQAEREFFKSIALERTGFLKNCEWIITKEMADKFGEATIVNHFKNLLRQTPRNARLLKYFGNTREGRERYDTVVKAINSGNLANIFKFVAHK